MTKYLIKILLLAGISMNLQAQTYKTVDTGQTIFYNNMDEISEPAPGGFFYGQDAQFSGHLPSYTDNGDGTVTDNVTGLMWQKSPDLDGDGDIDANDKLSFSEALAGAENFSLAGYDDWRLPDIKEQYSLIMFDGLDPSGYEGSEEGLVPFIDTDYFDFGYGDVSAGERLIDAQFATATLYVGLTMDGNETMFGVNFADGRIKGYPTGPMPGQNEDKGFYVLYVRGNTTYGINDLQDNGDGTVTDNATGLMWLQDDSQSGLNWEEALEYAQQSNDENLLGYNDWRLPNVKELQSIVDYSRAPSITDSPAIDPVFNCSSIIDEGGEMNYPFYWSGTTYANMQGGGFGAYVCFGEALGWMEEPPFSGNFQLLDVHGAGAQRSDPKQGDPEDFPYGNGPQGDVIRIYNHVRLVRDVADCSTGDVNDDGVHDVLDIIQTVQFILGLEIPSDQEYCAADMNQDNIIDIIDVVQMVNLILNSRAVHESATAVLQDDHLMTTGDVGGIQAESQLISEIVGNDQIFSSDEKVVIFNLNGVLDTHQFEFTSKPENLIIAASNSDIVEVRIQEMSLAVQSYPNPFNPVTNISFVLPDNGAINISIYNMQGRLVDTLQSGYQIAGPHQVSWNATGYSSGVYFVRISSATFSGEQKLILLK